MYYKLKYGDNYLIKIFALVIVAVAAELFIWWAMVREESVDWIAGHVTHNPWPYAITEMEDGRKIVGNVLIGFEVTIPPDWSIEKNKHPYFYLLSNSEENKILCEIKTDIIREKSIDEILKEEAYLKYAKFFTNGFSSIKREHFTSEKNFIYDLKIGVESNIISYTLFSDNKNRLKCKQGLEKIRRSWFYYPDAKDL